MAIEIDYSKLSSRLRRYAPFSAIDAGQEIVAAGNVSDLQIEGNTGTAQVTDRFGETHTTTVTVVSPTKWVARCSCSSAEDMDEQWCVHAMALCFALANSGEFDFKLDAVEEDSLSMRLSTTSADDVAKKVFALCEEGPHQHIAATQERPEIELIFFCDDESLGIQVTCSGEVVRPEDIPHMPEKSGRSLDTILLHLIDADGFWDEEQQHWYLHSSKAIENVLGLAEEYDSVLLANTGNALEISHEPLEAMVQVQWEDTSAELTLHWQLPDESLQIKQSELIGDGPYWTLLGETLYRLSHSAEELAKLFPFSATLTVSQSSTGSLINLVNDAELSADDYLQVRNPEDQPVTEETIPEVHCDLERIISSSPGSRNDGPLEVRASIDFVYPTPDPSENVVYVPNRAFETEQLDTLTSRGFAADEQELRYTIANDAALDFFYNQKELFPENWHVTGLSQVTSGLKFVNLTLVMDVGEGSNNEAFDARGINWFECEVRLTQNNAQIPLSALFKNPSSQQDKWIQLDSGAYAQVPGGGLKQLKTSLGMLEPNFHMASTVTSKLTTAQAIGLSRYESAGVAVTLDERATELRKKMENFEKLSPAKPSRDFKGTLRPYQKAGLGWMMFLKEFGLDGILADEMGLGKTVQTLALLSQVKAVCRKNKTEWNPAMIVAPTSVITNWAYEAKRFAPDMSVLLLHGPKRKAHFDEIPDHDLVITSFALLRIDRYELERHKFSYLVLDEAQNIKNPLAATTRAAKSIRSDRRLALTGTPTENRPQELWSIVDFLMPGYLGSLDFFRNHIEKPILENSENSGEVATFLHQKTKPFILRRLKRNVERDLPPKTESEVHVEMTPSQAALYASILEEVRPKIFEAVEEKGIKGASISILAALLRLRQVCNHPRSIEAFKEQTDYDSGKFDLLKELLTEALENGQKILLFSQFREMLSLMKGWLDEAGVNYLYLDGGTRNRQDLVDQFNSDDSVRLFLISLKAGGTGLNLTSADTVILYDPWWNPAVEMQAVDRAHRIGQTKPVNVYRLVTENTIEQKIMELKARKAAMVEALISDTGLSASSLTREDLEHFFSPLPAAE